MHHQTNNRTNIAFTCDLISKKSAFENTARKVIYELKTRIADGAIISIRIAELRSFRRAAGPLYHSGSTVTAGSGILR
jgi:hypothetical protein